MRGSRIVRTGRRLIVQKVMLGKISLARFQKVILGKIRFAGLQEVILGKSGWAGIKICISV